MPKHRHQQHHPTNSYPRTPAWKRDTLLLASIFRLRVHPAIPYPLIASTILTHFPDAITRFYTRYACPFPSPVSLPSSSSSSLTSPSSTDLPPINEDALLEWLARWLQERCEHAERWLGESYIGAIGKEESVVCELLDVCGFEELGFGVMREGEWRGRVKWLREGDWKAGSVPCEGGGGEWGVVGGPVPLPVSERVGGRCVEVIKGAGEDVEDDEVKRKNDINKELLERLRNLEFEDPPASAQQILAPQPVHVQQFLPLSLPPPPPPSPFQYAIQEATKPSTLNPQTPIFHPYQRTPEPTPAYQETEPIFFDPATGQILNFTEGYTPPPAPPQIAVDEYYHPEVLIDPKKASLAVRLQSRWNGFSEQLDEIKALEEMLRNRQAGQGAV